ncbi:MAG: tetratricopeptide repeat protein [bacterium]
MSFLNRLLGKDLQKLYDDAKKLIDENKFTDAVEKLKRAEELAPDSAAISWSLAFCYSRISPSSDTDEAYYASAKRVADAFSRAIELAKKFGGLNDKQLGIAYFVVGAFYQSVKQYDKSVPYLENAISNDPEHIEARLFLSSSYFFQGRVEEAERADMGALEREPENPKVIKHWKELRKQIGKDILDLPEHERRRIFLEYRETKNNAFLLEPNLLRDFRVALA